jgi:hypothetical protein
VRSALRRRRRRRQGRLEDAEALLEQALRTREARYGPAHLDVAASLNALGLLYYDQARHGTGAGLATAPGTPEGLARGKLKICGTMGVKYQSMRIWSLSMPRSNHGSAEAEEEVLSRDLSGGAGVAGW